MGVFNFGDPANRRPAWLAASWPTRRGEGGHAMPRYQPESSAVEPRPPAQGLRVLVVDDNPVHRMLASEMLFLWGIDPLLAEDGSEAVAVARERPLALILMDLQMPVLDGLGATLQIRRFEAERALPRVPIVAYSSAAFGSDRGLLEHVGMDGVLAKPCETHEMHACLLRWCPPSTVAASSSEYRARCRG